MILPVSILHNTSHQLVCSSYVGFVTPAMKPGLFSKKVRWDQEIIKRINLYHFNRSSTLVKFVYGNARFVNPLSTVPHPLPRAQAANT